MVISQMAVLFIVLAVGYIAGKAKMITPDGNKMLSRIVLHIATPCTLLGTVLSGNVNVSAGETAFFLLMTIPVFLITFLIAIPAARMLFSKAGHSGRRQDRGMYCYMLVFGNVTFMGLPVTYAIFGPASAYYVALFNIPFLLLNFSAGIYMVSGKVGGLSPKTLITPAFIAALVSIPVAIAGLSAPAVITDPVRLIGNMTTPGAMLVTGSALSQISLKNVFGEWRLYPVALLKLLVIPVIAWLALRPFVTNELMLGMLVLLTAMPVAMAASMLAYEYDGNERIASSGIFLTTLLSCATIPLLVFLLLT